MSADSTTFRLHHYLICAFDKIMSLWDLKTTGQLECVELDLLTEGESKDANVGMVLWKKVLKPKMKLF